MVGLRTFLQLFSKTKQKLTNQTKTLSLISNSDVATRQRVKNPDG
jgi:hypothetical protein